MEFLQSKKTPPIFSIDVACAVIVQAGKILITQRHEKDHCGGFWEFPGGKRLAAESLPQCLKREVAEELGIRIEPGRMFKKIDYPYPDRCVSLYFYECRMIEGAPMPRRSHALRWVWPFELKKYPFPPANQAILDILSAR